MYRGVGIVLGTLRIAAAALALLAALALASAAAQEAAEPFAFETGGINTGLKPANPPVRLDTPRAALESFLDAIRRRDYERAAHVLNLDAVPPEEQAGRAPMLAVMLAYVLRRQDLVDWSQLPDEPDARVLPGLQQSVGPYSRRSVPLGEVDVEGRPVPVGLQRFRTGEEEPVWLFSPFAVERIPAMYAASRPGLFADLVPLERRLKTLGQTSTLEWLAAAAFLAGALLVWLLVYGATWFPARWLPGRWINPVRRSAMPLAVLLAATSFTLGTTWLFPLTGPVGFGLGIAAEIVALAAAAWLLLRVLSAVTLSLSERYVVSLPVDDPEHRRTKTTVYVVRRLALVAIALLSLAWILVRAGLLESFGVSVLASAGAFGVLLAVAARPLIGNMVGGLQIALTDPLRIGDVVVFDRHLATVENIFFSHTVLRTDTDTRVIVPHTELLARPFENWSKEGEAVWRVVKVPADYEVDVAAVRAEVARIVADDPRSAHDPPVELVEADADGVLVWIWVSGTTAGASWTLHNDVREKVIAFLKAREGGAWLPRRRLVLTEAEARTREASRPPPRAPADPPRMLQPAGESAEENTV